MAGNFTYWYVFQKNIAYAVSRANFLTYLTAMQKTTIRTKALITMSLLYEGACSDVIKYFQ